MSLLIYIRPGENWEPETWALKEKKTMFERVFQMRLNFEVRVDTKISRLWQHLMLPLPAFPTRVCRQSSE